MKNIFLLASILLLSMTINAQTLFELLNNTNKIKSGYKISGEVRGLQDTSVILAYYFGGKQFATDTAEVINGKFTFEGEKDLKGGMYLVVLSESNYFDIIVSEKEFSFSTKLNDLVGKEFFVGNVKLKGHDLCQPCKGLQDNLNQTNLVKKLLNKGGLRCEILTDGKILVGDKINY